MFKLKGPQIHFWVSEKAVSESKPPSTNSEAGKRSCTEQLAQQPVVDDRKRKELPAYDHVEIF